MRHLNLEDNDRITDIASVTASLEAALAVNKDPVKRAAKAKRIKQVEADRQTALNPSQAPLRLGERRRGPADEKCVCGRMQFNFHDSGQSFAVAPTECTEEGCMECTEMDLSNMMGNINVALVMKEMLLVGTALKTLDKLTRLVMHNNKMGCRHARMIADALSINPALTYVDLSSNVIEYNGGMFLGTALNANTVLKTLSLLNNKLGDIGAVALAEGLKGNTGLTTLDLGANNIGVRGATAIAEALKSNTALRTLNMEDNHYSLKDAPSITASIQASLAENNDPIQRAAKEAAIKGAPTVIKEAEATRKTIMTALRACRRRWCKSLWYWCTGNCILRCQKCQAAEPAN